MKHGTRMIVLGALGGVVGSLLAELIPSSEGGAVSVILEVAIWGAVLSAPLAIMLRWGVALGGGHRVPPVPQLVLASLAGIVSGAVGGGVAQAVFNLFEDGWFKQLVARTFCWGIVGCLIGLVIGFGIPNLRRGRSAAMGATGGLLGGALFVALSELPQVPGAVARAGGIGMIGALIALAVVATEAIQLRKGLSLEINYGKGEVVRRLLGTDAVTIGGTSSDSVYVPGYPAKALSVLVDSGTIVALQPDRGRVVLKHGSSIQLGRVVIKVIQS
jgi:hypothetical protein